MKNLAELVCDRVERRPGARFGIAGDATPTLEQAAGRAMGATGALEQAGAGLGRRVALIGTTSDSYLTAWLALVLAGAEVAMVNPDYPDELLAEMLEQLAPEAVVWVGREVSPPVAAGAVHLDAGGLDRGVLASTGGRVIDAVAAAGLDGLADAPGLGRDRFDVAGWMHTSGTTGVPKFCEQTHEYFLRLGRFIADSMCFSEADTVLAPLPMFHINPLGYGVIGGLTGGVDVLGLERFSASGFWPLVRAVGATVLILHAPPVEILKRATTAADAAGHQVSRVFFADADFLETFGVPLGFSAYGSTEAGGLCHIWAWRRGERPELAEGMSRYGGRARHEVQWQVDDRGEIRVRADREGALFSGYRRADGLLRPFDEDGWFATGDLGRTDEAGNLVFIERRSESIRVKGEFVPIGYVEQRFASVDGIDDVAVWRRDSDLVGDEIVLYMTGESIPTDAILATSSGLPTFMRPSAVARVDDIPRDSGVGKVRRRLLTDIAVQEWIDLQGARS
ncbi:MAG: class I adenylate-forming enzyme family protein [Acidimicrobiaceae bacterium]|nr:class I adenylate-forming enzyme family protein [Acidimicrobiaceae bacterium]